MPVSYIRKLFFYLKEMSSCWINTGKSEVVVDSDSDSISDLAIELNAREHPESIYYESVEVPMCFADDPAFCI